MSTFDAAIIGGGLVGSAVAYGLARAGAGAVALVDEGDVAIRASRGNFALVWLQGKGDGMPRYAAWTRQSIELWSDFARELRDATGIEVCYAKPGGVHVCFDDREIAERRRLLERLKAQAEPPGYDFDILDRRALADRLPGLGPDVAGGTYCPHDGHCNSLRLFRALHRAFIQAGGRYLARRRVTDVRAVGDSFVVETAQGPLHAGRVVLAAGHGNAWLAPRLGMQAPVTPNRGQVMVTERFQPILPLPTALARQTNEGTIMLGDSKEDVGFDDRTTTATMREIADKARRAFPFLARARIVRVWGCIRIMPPDGFAIYDRSPDHPNAYAVSCHSGVTLAAVHARLLARWIAAGPLDSRVAAFSGRRFAVRKAA